jgi:hypothetical protein
MKNISQKPRHKNTPVKQLISILVDRYSKATARERQSILRFLDWLIETTVNPQLKGFHTGVKSRLTEVR